MYPHVVVGTCVTLDAFLTRSATSLTSGFILMEKIRRRTGVPRWTPSTGTRYWILEGRSVRWFCDATVLAPPFEGLWPLDTRDILTSHRHDHIVSFTPTLLITSPLLRTPHLAGQPPVTIPGTSTNPNRKHISAYFPKTRTVVRCQRRLCLSLSYSIQ